MRTSRIFLNVLFAVAIAALPVAAIGATVYDNDRPGWEAAVGSFREEFFADAVLEPGVSVTSTGGGHVEIATGVWWDMLNCPGSGESTTIWHFDKPLRGFGGTWNPGVPGGPGAGISVEINGSWILVGEIPNNYVNVFWGFTSDVPFTDVRLHHGSGCGLAWTERYEMDNMVWSELINYLTGGGKVGAKKPEWTFGGNVGFDTSGAPIGQFQINDHSNGVAYHATSISALAFSGGPATSPAASLNTAVFTAEFRGNDGSTKIVTVTIQDLGEGGDKVDTIQLAGDLVLAQTVIKGGNFQVHQVD